MENEMIERVAKAMFAEAVKQTDGRATDLSYPSELTEVMTFEAIDFRQLARAALEGVAAAIAPYMHLDADGSGARLAAAAAIEAMESPKEAVGSLQGIVLHPGIWVSEWDDLAVIFPYGKP